MKTIYCRNLGADACEYSVDAETADQATTMLSGHLTATHPELADSAKALIPTVWEVTEENA
jgi:hypothetical protein